MILKKYLKLGNFIFNLNLSLYFLPKTKTQGVYDRIPDTPFHVLFLDYDRSRLDWIRQEVKWMQKQFGLGDIIILESSKNSYHIICFDFLTKEQINEITNISNCDEKFKRSLIFDFDSKVLRTHPKGNTEKPKFIEIIKSKSNNKKAMGHIKYYKLWFDIYEGLIDETNAVETTIDTIEYPTKTNVE